MLGESNIIDVERKGDVMVAHVFVIAHNKQGAKARARYDVSTNGGVSLRLQENIEVNSVRNVKFLIEADEAVIDFEGSPRRSASMKVDADDVIDVYTSFTSRMGGAKFVIVQPRSSYIPSVKVTEEVKLFNQFDIFDGVLSETGITDIGFEGTYVVSIQDQRLYSESSLYSYIEPES